jgi:hypothetical protein
MADDPEKALEELRKRIAAEGLPKLSPEALRAFKRGSMQSRLAARDVEWLEVYVDDGPPDPFGL